MKTPQRWRWPAAVLSLLAAACGAPDAPPPPEDAGSTADAGEQADAGPPDSGLLALSPGDVAELAVSAGKTGVSLATPLGTEKFVIVLASTRLDSSADSLGYSLGLSSAPEGAAYSAVTGCSIGIEPWRSTALLPETAPTGTAVTQGTIKTLSVPTPAGFESIQAEAIAVGARAVVWADKTVAHPANLDPGFVTAFLADFENIILPRQRTVFGM
ncbi:MAG: hypothetical protein ACYC8T_15460, partial [Myxococcaceae bacterium]